MGLYLEHVGRPHDGAIPHSGRYKWGSGEDPYQGAGGFWLQVRELEKSGKAEKDIAKLLGMSIQEMRDKKTVDRAAMKQDEIRRAKYLRDEKQYSLSKIAEIMGVSGESYVRGLLKDDAEQKAKATDNVAEALREAVAEKKYIDVGAYVGSYLGVSDTRLKAAVTKLEEEGYERVTIKVEQLGTGEKTKMVVLAPKGTTAAEVQQHIEEISLPTGVRFQDNGLTLQNIKPPIAVDPKRVAVRYAEEGGTDRDGVIEIRRGVDDLNLGDSRYAQVRIKVGEDHYLKGMAMYSDDLPDGVDLRFNTNKHAGTPMLGDKNNTVLKLLKDNPDNPFGATIDAQNSYTDKNGVEHQGVVNIVRDEGEWSIWSKNLSSQFLSKQLPSLAKKQLDQLYNEKKAEFEEISSLTNPEVKKKLLESFYDDCDSAAIHLKAAAMPGQATHVILPFPDMDPKTVYAPQYEDGTPVVLIRYPHGGRFEIPDLVVNNKGSKAAKDAIGDSIDAIGIHPKVAETLSGADFDGDTVLVIPNREGLIKTRKRMSLLEDFDPKEDYKAYPGMKKVGLTKDGGDGFDTQAEMGKISNLITDMTLKGADYNEIAHAVRHSMVVIDAEKHQLDWKASYANEGIAALKAKYQGVNENGQLKGASTLISRIGADERVDERKKWYRKDIDPETGEKIYKTTGRYYDPGKKVVDPETGLSKWEPTGKLAKATTTVQKGEVYKPEELSSGTAMETVYVNHSNRMHQLANQARKEWLATPSQEYSPTAAKTYSPEVASMKAKLNVALKNAPLERMAQRYANAVVRQKKKDNPSMDKDDLKKVKSQTLASARARVGAKKTLINITPKEWQAIQAGAINKTTLNKILNNTDIDVIKSYATPRSPAAFTTSQINQMKAMLKGNSTIADVASRFGVSPSTVYQLTR